MGAWAEEAAEQNLERDACADGGPQRGRCDRGQRTELYLSPRKLLEPAKRRVHAAMMLEAHSRHTASRRRAAAGTSAQLTSGTRLRRLLGRLVHWASDWHAGSAGERPAGGWGGNEGAEVQRDTAVQRAPGTRRSTMQRVLGASSDGEGAEAASRGSAASFSRQTGAS